MFDLAELAAVDPHASEAALIERIAELEQPPRQVRPGRPPGAGSARR